MARNDKVSYSCTAGQQSEHKKNPSNTQSLTSTQRGKER